MNAFLFRAVPRTLVERGGAARLGAQLAALGGARRPLVVTDPGVRAAGLLDAALAGLVEAGAAAAIFDGVEADPPVAAVRAAAEAARAHDADAVVGLGGGSALDTAKLAALLAGAPDLTLEALFGVDRVPPGARRLPLALAPTTAGTGSEATSVAIVTAETGEKIGIVDDALFPDLALLDARLTLGLPRAATAATGLDAMVHAIEAYTSRLKKNPVSDMLAREALGRLAGHLVRACEAPDDIEAREAMLLGANLAGQAFANAPVGAVHALAYPLGARFHVPHGLSNAMMLEPTLIFNLPEAAPLYAELGDVVGAPDTGGFEARAEAFVAAMSDICAATGLDLRLQSAGVTAHDLPGLAEEAAGIERLLQNNPRPVSYDDALALYREAFARGEA